MKAKLIRTYYPKYTKGDLTVDNGFTCDTLELPWLNNASQISCIPKGVYKVVPRQSAKYGRHLHVTNVQGREFILIHWGNYAGSNNPATGHPDIKGCILVGYGYADLNGDGLPEITRSKSAFIDLMSKCGEGFELTIE
jgi:hypothetical protein